MYVPKIASSSMAMCLEPNIPFEVQLQLDQLPPETVDRLDFMLDGSTMTIQSPEILDFSFTVMAKFSQGLTVQCRAHFDNGDRITSEPITVFPKKPTLPLEIGQQRVLDIAWALFNADNDLSAISHEDMMQLWAEGAPNYLPKAAAVVGCLATESGIPAELMFYDLADRN